MRLNPFSILLLVFAAVALIATAAYPGRETWIAAAVFAGAAIVSEAVVRWIDRRDRKRAADAVASRNGKQ